MSVRKYLPGTASPGTVVPFSCPSLWCMSVLSRSEIWVVQVDFNLHIAVLYHKHTDCNHIA